MIAQVLIENLNSNVASNMLVEQQVTVILITPDKMAQTVRNVTLCLVKDLLKFADEKNSEIF